MFFWIFMLAMCLMTPILMTVIGMFFKRKAPEDINLLFGYRTTLSMKNKDTWVFAHRYIGKLWVKMGLALFPISIIPMLFVIGKSEDVIGYMGAGIVIIGVILLIISIIPTEIALHKTFDNNGNRKTKSSSVTGDTNDKYF